MTVAADLHALTDGAWDGTVNPLVNLWGFGSRKVAPRVPDPKEIDALLPDVGFRHITVSKDATLSKDLGRVSVDLASIAKGYGVDQAAAVISASGIDHFIVEIGGEVYARGLRPDGKPWRIGINTPKPMAGATEVYKVVALSDRALATSGDYRIFFHVRRQAVRPHPGSPNRAGRRKRRGQRQRHRADLHLRRRSGHGPGGHGTGKGPGPGQPASGRGMPDHRRGRTAGTLVEHPVPGVPGRILSRVSVLRPMKKLLTTRDNFFTFTSCRFCNIIFLISYPSFDLSFPQDRLVKPGSGPDRSGQFR